MKPINSLPATFLLLVTMLVATACTAGDGRETPVAPGGPALVFFYTDN